MPKANAKARILVLITHYLPGYKAGGTIPAVANIIDWLGDDFDFHVVTKDRDLGDAQPYPNITVGKWQSVGKAQVLYLPPAAMKINALRQYLQGLDYDVVYVNSFFDALTVYFMLLRRLGLLAVKPLLLSPHGMLAPGALSLKPWKKQPYIFAAKLAGLYRGITWVATSDYETQEIRNYFKTDLDRQRSLLYQAANLPPRLSSTLSLKSMPISKTPSRPPKMPGAARIAFISRVSRKKNLDIALKLLANVAGRVEFDIYGPIEDPVYWEECQALIKVLPSHVIVSYRGALHAEDVIPTFGCYHLFLFPTRGENYGYTILEAFCSGCLVLTSDMTFWRNLEAQQVGWDIPLHEPDRFQSALAALLNMDDATFQKCSQLAYALGKSMSEDQNAVNLYRQLFEVTSESGQRTLQRG